MIPWFCNQDYKKPIEYAAAPLFFRRMLHELTCHSTANVADDEPAITDVLGPKLLRTGMQMLKAEDGETALEMAKLLVPALILLDERMPGMRGLEVCRHLAESSVTAGIPVIMLTGLSIGSDVPPNVRMVVSKPFSAKAIIETIREILANPVAERGVLI